MNANSLEPPATILKSIRNAKHKARRNEAFQDLLANWEPVVVAMARRYAPRRADRPDFEQTGRLAILRAAEKFRAGLGHRFEHYARRSLRNALLDHREQVGRKEAGVVRVQIVIADPSADGDVLVRQEVRAAVRRECRRLDRRLQTIIERVFWEGQSQAEAARSLRVTPARVNQLLKRFRERGQEDFRHLVD